MLDENHIVVLQANRPPTVADMEGIAKRFNHADTLRAAAEAALPVLDHFWQTWESDANRAHYKKIAEQLRAALHPQPEEGK